MDSRDALRATSHSTRLPSARSEVVSAHTAATVRLGLRLPATPSSASILRTELDNWLRSLRAAGGTIFDLQVACAEVLTIMVEQNRSALVVEVDGSAIDTSVTVTIREFGLCGQSGHARARSDQPLSLSLIEAVTDTLEVHEHTDGRTFILQRRI